MIQSKAVVLVFRRNRQLAKRGVGDAAVVAHEDDDGVARDAVTREFVEDTPDGIVEAPNHRGIDGVGLAIPAARSFGFKVRDVVRLGLMRRVNGEFAEVEEEWFGIRG